MAPRTIAAIKRFQTDRYMTVSGQLDEATLAALGVSGSSNVAAHVASLTEPVNLLVSFSDESGKHGILAATNAGLYRTIDPSQGWDRLNYGRGLDVRTTAISTNPEDPRVVFVGTATAGVLVS